MAELQIDLALVLHLREHSLEDFQRGAIEEHKVDALERRRTAEMRANFLEHRLRASLDWKPRDAGANRRKCDRLERVLIGAHQRVARRCAYIRLRRPCSQPRARRVNYMPRTQPSRARNRRLAQCNRPNPVAFLRNRRARSEERRVGKECRSRWS